MSVTVKKMRGTSTGAWPLTIDWSPDGKRVLLALNSSVDPSPLQILRADGLELESALRGHDGGLYAARFSRDGRQVVSAGGTTVRRWETHNCQELQRVAWDGECVNSVSFSRDCRYLLFVNTGNISDVFPIHHVEVLDVTTGRIVRRLRGHTQEIYGLAFCPTNGRILSVDDDGTIWLTDLRSKRDVQRFVGHSDWLYAIGFSPDGSRFASAGIGTPDPTLRVWEIASGDEIWSAESECATGFDRLTWSRDGKKLITSDGGADSRGAVRISDALTGEHLLEFNHGATGVVSALSPDGSTLVTGDEKGWIQTWRLQDVKTLASGGIPSTTHTSDAINSTLGTGAASLEDAKRSLQGLIGLASVKQEISGNILAACLADPVARLRAAIVLFHWRMLFARWHRLP